MAFFILGSIFRRLIKITIMSVENIMNEMRKIMVNRAKNMDAVDIDTRSLDITKENLYSELKALIPGITNDEIREAVREAESRGFVELITPDIITFTDRLIN